MKLSRADNPLFYIKTFSYVSVLTSTLYIILAILMNNILIIPAIFYAVTGLGILTLKSKARIFGLFGHGFIYIIILYLIFINPQKNMFSAFGIVFSSLFIFYFMRKSIKYQFK